MKTAEKKEFDPNDIGVANGNYFGLPVEADEADLVLLPVPWDATVSYGAGTAEGPGAVLDASLQVDLYDYYIPEAWRARIGTLPAEEALAVKGRQARSVAEAVISRLERGEDPAPEETARVNALCREMNDAVYAAAARQLAAGRRVGVVGGDHSTPLGAIRAAGERFGNFGILHVDAHADLRVAYEGFEFSHASIMFNVLGTVPQVTSLVQVGVRDFCEQEARLMHDDPRITAFPDAAVRRRLFEGETWGRIVEEMLAALPEQVYVSFDIDGLSPEYCGGTGTPVPGGLSFAEAEYLLARLSASGRRIIGFDLCEVAPGADGEWDANVGARMLFKLALHCLHSDCQFRKK